MPLLSEKIIQEFTDHLKYQKRYSQHTIISYQTDLEDFALFITTKYGETSLTGLSATIIRTWLAKLKQNKISSRSINRKISTLKSFFRYQLRTGKITVSPMTIIQSLKVSKRLPSFIEQKDLNTLFRNVEFPDTWEGRLEELILKIFYNTGIRLSELINLKEINIDKSNGNIKVMGKGSKERLIPVNKQLLTDIENYIAAKRKCFGETAKVYVLVSGKGKKLYARYVYNAVKKYLNLVSTNDKKSPHILRHSFATHLTNNGADINAIKELLGHSSLAATQVYTSNSIEKLKDIHKKSHPKA
ncbi:MAG: tyrosine-type recombinase/integrase [Chitinophagaceae bacterium]|nr:tyrosine-type recombinase/integrase [Chitinophagaceae bacterium]